ARLGPPSGHANGEDPRACCDVAWHPASLSLRGLFRLGPLDRRNLDAQGTRSRIEGRRTGALRAFVPHTRPIAPAAAMQVSCIHGVLVMRHRDRDLLESWKPCTRLWFRSGALEQERQ